LFLFFQFSTAVLFVGYSHEIAPQKADSGALAGFTKGELPRVLRKNSAAATS